MLILHTDSTNDVNFRQPGEAITFTKLVELYTVYQVNPASEWALENMPATMVNTINTWILTLLGLEAFQVDVLRLCILVRTLGSDLFTAVNAILRLLLGVVLVMIQLLRLVVDLTPYLVLGFATHLLHKTYQILQTVVIMAVFICLVRAKAAFGLVVISCCVLVVFMAVSTVPFVEYLLPKGETTTSVANYKGNPSSN